MRKIRIYATLGELFSLGFTTANVQSAVNTYTQSKDTFDAKFTDVIDILADSYSDWYVGYVDKVFIPGLEVELSQTDSQTILVKFLKSFMVKYNYTKEKYLKLLTLYANAQNNLMSQLSSTTSGSGSHRVNDTPQNGGSWEDDNHTSMYESTDNTSTTTSDPMTVMARLEEVQNKYMNVLKSWCDEFKKLFITPTDEFDVTVEGD